MKDISLVFIVAGLSSRFGGRIKQLINIGPNNETLIEYSLNQAIKSGFKKIIFVVSTKTEEPFKKLFKSNYKGLSVEYAFQHFDTLTRDKPWGTLDALCCAKELINTSFIFCNGDDIYGETSFKILFNHLQESEDCASIGYPLQLVLPKKGNVNRALIDLDENSYGKSVIEIFDINNQNFKEKGLRLTNLMSMNLFALHKNDLEKLNLLLLKFKEQNKRERTKEALIQTEITSLIKEGKLKMKVYSTPDKWLGVTNPEDEELIRHTINPNK